MTKMSSSLEEVDNKKDKNKEDGSLDLSNVSSMYENEDNEEQRCVYGLRTNSSHKNCESDSLNL